MLAHGIYVIAFNPVVPTGKARIRVQLSAAHSEDELRRRAVGGFRQRPGQGVDVTMPTSPDRPPDPRGRHRAVCRRARPRGGLPLLVLHGGPGLDHTMFGSHLDALAETYRLVLVDGREQGRSARGPTLPAGPCSSTPVTSVPWPPPSAPRAMQSSVTPSAPSSRSSMPLTSPAPRPPPSSAAAFRRRAPLEAAVGGRVLRCASETGVSWCEQVTCL